MGITMTASGHEAYERRKRMSVATERHLRNLGYAIVSASGYRCDSGRFDLVARDPLGTHVLVKLSVVTGPDRKVHAWRLRLPPMDTVGPAARCYERDHPSTPVRVDLVRAMVPDTGRGERPEIYHERGIWYGTACGR